MNSNTGKILELVSYYKEAKIMQFLEKNYTKEVNVNTKQELLTETVKYNLPDIVSTEDINMDKNKLSTSFLDKGVYILFDRNTILVEESEPKVSIKQSTIGLIYSVDVIKTDDKSEIIKINLKETTNG